MIQTDDLTGLALRYARCSMSAGRIPDGWPLVVTATAPTAVEATVYDPVVCLILQGAKETAGPGGALRLAPGDGLLVSHDTPVLARIVEASPAAPYVAVVAPLDLGVLRGLHDATAELAADGGPAGALGRIGVGDGLRDVLRRWLGLEPGTAEARVVGPLLRTELHFRLLAAPGGDALRQLASPTSPASRIARAIAAIRRDVSRPLRLADLARTAGMGGSAFHAHFRQVTGTTPLRFQKDLRLTDARRRLAAGDGSVTGVAYAVGYESSAQFSREYARKFGHPPRTDLARTGAPD